MARPPATEDEIDAPTPTLIVDDRYYERGDVADWHTHQRGQLLYATTGLMRVWFDAGSWVIPPQRAAWVPCGVAHRAEMIAPTVTRGVYIGPAASRALGNRVASVEISPLLRELIAEAVRLPRDYEPSKRTRALVTLLLSEIRLQFEGSLFAPAVEDRRLRAIERRLFDSDSLNLTLAQWAREVGCSARHLARLIESECGMSFSRWRRAHRMVEACRLFALGHPIKDVAYRTGFADVSAFAAAFKASMGETPGVYRRRTGAANDGSHSC